VAIVEEVFCDEDLEERRKFPPPIVCVPPVVAVESLEVDSIEVEQLEVERLEYERVENTAMVRNGVNL
jgi:hypothetical protein